MGGRGECDSNWIAKLAHVLRSKWTPFGSWVGATASMYDIPTGGSKKKEDFFLGGSEGANLPLMKMDAENTSVPPLSHPLPYLFLEVFVCPYKKNPQQMEVCRHPKLYYTNCNWPTLLYIFTFIVS